MPAGRQIEVIEVERRYRNLPDVNTQHLRPGGYRGKCDVDDSCAGWRGGRHTYINSDREDADDVSAHELSHGAGAEDGYEGGRGRDPVTGRRNQASRFNRPESDIMSRLDGSEWTQETLDEIDNHPGTTRRDRRANNRVCAATGNATGNAYPGCTDPH